MFQTRFPLPLAALAALALALPAQAAEIASTDLYVTATVLDSCTVTAPTGLTFASVNTSAATNQTVQGSIAVVCTAAKPDVSINLEGGDNESGGVRHMKSATNDLLPYIIASDAAYSAQVGVGDALYSGPLSAVTPNLIPVYGQIPAGSYAAGVYTDTVRVTLNY